VIEFDRWELPLWAIGWSSAGSRCSGGVYGVASCKANLSIDACPQQQVSLSGQDVEGKGLWTYYGVES